MKPRKYTPSKRVRSHIAKWEASDFAGLNAAFGGDAVGAKAVELMNMLGDKANAFTDNELDGLLSTYYNLSPAGFRKTLMPYIDAYVADLSDLTRMKLDQAMRNRWTIAALKYLKGIRRRAAADADLMGLKYNQPIIEQPDAVRVKPVIPELNTRATWSGAEDASPYVTGKPTLNIKPKILLPTVEEVLEDSAWQPPFPRLKPAYKNGRLPGFKDGTRYIPDGNGGWDRITDDEMADAFANLVVTPKGSTKENVVNRLSEYDFLMRQKLRNAGYVTDEMIAQDNRIRYLNQLRGRGELPLEQVSPEFDLLTIGESTPFRTGKTLRQLRALNKEMDAVFAEGLKHCSKDVPWIYDADPDYSYMSPDGYRVFSTERLDHPNKYDEAGNHFVVVGPRGSKQLNIVGKWDPTVNTKSHGHGGNYIPGTSRNLGAIGAAVAAGSTTLSPRKKKNK